MLFPSAATPDIGKTATLLTRGQYVRAALTLGASTSQECRRRGAQRSSIDADSLR